MSRIHTSWRLVLAMTAFIAVFVTAMPDARAGGPPREQNFVFDITYLGCVDDVVDEPGTDGRALVRLRLTNDSLEDVVVHDGAWRLVVDGSTVAQAAIPGPSNLPIDGTWESVVQIPGGSGPATFSAAVEVTGDLGTSTFAFQLLEVPGDCPQPVEPTTTTVATPSAPPPAAQASRAAPRFTG
jgi:hypothetical protein